MFASPHATLHEGKSLDILDALPRADAYLIDGDHNFHTVSNELAIIGRRHPERFPLVVLHDTGWPCGHRDFYYSPDSIPAGERQPFVFEEGVVTWSTGTVQGGFRGEGAFAVARREGGSNNGVLAAVRSFRVQRDLAEWSIPCIFGLTILADHALASSLKPILDPFHENPLLRRLERNRLDLYLKVIELSDRLAGRTAAPPRSPARPVSATD